MSHLSGRPFSDTIGLLHRFAPERAELRPRRIQSRAHGPYRNAKDTRDLLVLQPFDLAQHERRAHRRRQAIEKALDLQAELRTGRGSPLSRMRRILGDIGFAMPAGQPPSVQTDAQDDGVEPGIETSLATVRVQAAKSANKRLLRRILCL